MGLTSGQKTFLFVFSACRILSGSIFYVKYKLVWSRRGSLSCGTKSFICANKKHTAQFSSFSIMFGLVLDVYNINVTSLEDRIFLYKTASDKKVQVTQDVKCV